MITTKTSVNCPVCNDVAPKEILCRYTARQAASHFCPVKRNRENNERLEECIKRLWNADDSLVLRCDQCGFGFGHPFVGGDSEFYGILHQSQGYSKSTWDFRFAQETVLNALEGGKILDIGAGTGNFLRELNSSWKLHAAEGSETTRRQLEVSGIKVFRDLDDAISNEAGSFTAITMFQVLEHIAEFHKTLEACFELLSPGGYFVVTVPEGNAMILQERVTGLPDMVPNHINKWTENSLKIALKRVGLVPETVVQEPSSWRKLRNALHLRLIADASQNEQSLAAFVYGIQNKPIRAGMLGLLSPIALAKMLPYIGRLRKGGAFGIIARKPDRSSCPV